MPTQDTCCTIAPYFLEVHGKESELAKLREALAPLPVVYYVLENGFRR